MCPARPSASDPQQATAPTDSYLAGAQPRAPLAALVRVSGAAADPAVYRLEKGICAIGSGRHNDVIIEDRAVSRSHLELELVAEGIAVRDLGSRNGTYFGSHRVERMVLAYGSALKVGRATIVVETDAASFYGPTAFAEQQYLGMLGASSGMRHLFGMLERLRGSMIPVLIEGDSGVGKELAARAVHLGSHAADGPFIAVNCGALTRELVSSELFGHVRGAFTGAAGARKGAFVAAEGGTLFLDEVGELPMEVQPALLRALEVGEIRAVGSDTPRKVDTRVVAATHRDLFADIAAGRFRQDLYYRLAVIKLSIPSLASRMDDIPLLANHFACGLGAGPLPPEVLQALQTRPWPGNVRELRNVVHAYTVLGSLPAAEGVTGDSLAEALGQFAASEAPYAQLKEELVGRFTQAYVRVLMARAAGNQTVAARLAGLDRSYLGRLLAKYG